jgi:excisionase family DNA binding protein
MKHERATTGPGQGAVIAGIAGAASCVGSAGVTMGGGSGDDLVADGLLTVAEATSFLSVSRSTLYGLMDQGRLAWVKIGRARRVPKRALVALASANLRGGDAAG